MTKESSLTPLARAVLRTQTDARLVSLAREGREAAFEEIVRRYRPGLVAFAAAFAPADRTEDVVQESLVRCWTALEESDEEINLKPWLYTIVRNRALNARRDAKTHQPLSDQVDGVAQPHELLLSGEELTAVVSAVRALPDTQREALVRSALDGHTHEQIASALGSSPGAVRQLIYRARVNLRTSVGLLIPLPLVRMLTEYGGAGGEAAATGITLGGAAAGAGAAGGASVVTKLGAVAVAALIAAGAGVAIERSDRNGGDDTQTVAQRSSEPGSPERERTAGDTVTPLAAFGQSPAAADRLGKDGSTGSHDSGADGSSGPGSGPSGHGESGEDGASERDVDDDQTGDDSGPSGSGQDGPDPSDEPETEESGSDDSGPDPSDEPETEESGSDDSGSSGSDSGSGSSDSGSGSDGDSPELDRAPAEPEIVEPDANSDSSGSGSGSSGSGDLDQLLDPAED